MGYNDILRGINNPACDMDIPSVNWILLIGVVTYGGAGIYEILRGNWWAGLAMIAWGAGNFAFAMSTWR